MREPSGAATIETYCVLHDRVGPSSCVLFGRLQSGGGRFLAMTDNDPAGLRRFVEQDAIGLTGTVNRREGRNLFTPSWA